MKIIPAWRIFLAAALTLCVATQASSAAAAKSPEFQRVLQQAGLPFNDYIRQRIFTPCRMKHAVLNAAPDTPRLARAFNADGKEDSTDMPVTGVAYMTARDLLDWTTCLQRGRVVTRESLQLLGRSFEPKNGALSSTVWEGERLVAHSHGGQSRNFDALMRCDFRTGRTIILLSNQKRQNLQQIADSLEAL